MRRYWPGDRMATGSAPRVVGVRYDAAADIGSRNQGWCRRLAKGVIANGEMRAGALIAAIMLQQIKEHSTRAKTDVFLEDQ